jgi:hypothetical protein
LYASPRNLGHEGGGADAGESPGLADKPGAEAGTLSTGASLIHEEKTAARHKNVSTKSPSVFNTWHPQIDPDLAHGL